VKSLTTQQKRVLIWLARYQRKNFTTPSYAEIAKAFDVSANSIGLHIKALEKKKFIKRSPHTNRSIVVLKLSDK